MLRLPLVNFFRATDSFTNSNGLVTSISTAGGSGSGNITIQHGGNGEIPFEVGNATTNGTAAAITSGEFTIAPFRSFLFTQTQENIQIISVESPFIFTPPQATNPVLPINLFTPQPSSDAAPPTKPSNPQTIDPPNKLNPADLNESSPLSTLPPITNDIPEVEIDTLAEVEEDFTFFFENYLGINNTSIVTLKQVRALLRQQIEQAIGVKPAIIYAFFVPEILPPQEKELGSWGSWGSRTHPQPNPPLTPPRRGKTGGE